MEAKLPAGWILEGLKIPLLTTTHKNIHLEVFFPLRKRLEFFGRTKSFDWPLYCCLPRWFLTNPVLFRVVWESAELPSSMYLIWNVFMFTKGARSLGAPPIVQLSRPRGNVILRFLEPCVIDCCFSLTVWSLAGGLGAGLGWGAF